MRKGKIKVVRIFKDIYELIEGKISKN